MKPEAIKDYLMINGEIEKVSDSDIFERIDSPPIYEVIRVMDGVPLFLDDHIDRMRESGKIVDFDISRKDKDIREDIFELIDRNNIKDLNVKLLAANIEGGQVFVVYFIDSFYPPKDYYEDGIHTILFDHERPNPNAKVLLTDFKENISRKLDEEEAFEALLVNKENKISEGSRSNMFFVKADKVYTAPAGDVLMGITRKYIMKSCKDNNIDIVEENFDVEELSNIDGAFMSGTSVDVLPISSIGDLKINSTRNSIVKKLYNGYKDYVKKDIEKNRR